MGLQEYVIFRIQQLDAKDKEWVPQFLTNSENTWNYQMQKIALEMTAIHSIKESNSHTI